MYSTENSDDHNHKIMTCKNDGFTYCTVSILLRCGVLTSGSTYGSCGFVIGRECGVSGEAGAGAGGGRR